MLPALDHIVPGSNPAVGSIQLMTEWHLIAQSLSLSPLNYLDVTKNIERDVKHQIIIRKRSK